MNSTHTYTYTEEERERSITDIHIYNNNTGARCINLLKESESVRECERMSSEQAIGRSLIRSFIYSCIHSCFASRSQCRFDWIRLKSSRTQTQTRYGSVDMYVCTGMYDMPAGFD